MHGETTGIWKTGMWIAIAVVAVLFVGLEAVAIRRFRARRKAVVTVTPSASK